MSLPSEPSADPLPVPEPGDWLDLHDEPGQSLAAFRSKFRLARYLGSPRRPIAVYPLGGFPPSDARRVAAYLRRWTGLPALVRRPIADALDVPDHARRGRRVGCQYLQQHVLLQLLGDEELFAVGLTDADLFHEDPQLQGGLLGEATTELRTAVVSRSRVGRYPGDASWRPWERLLKGASHEVGHLLGMHHCTAFACNLNGVANLDELDALPATLCPVCRAKLRHALGPEREDRCARLGAYWRAMGVRRHAERYGVSWPRGSARLGTSLSTSRRSPPTARR